jgi:hypothetical protein
LRSSAEMIMESFIGVLVILSTRKKNRGDARSRRCGHRIIAIEAKL